ncbi:hypothetical protein A2U01_0103944, partial [Trifolium medium]|nr:hypothetical protein [Trifolium medium]
RLPSPGEVWRHRVSSKTQNWQVLATDGEHLSPDDNNFRPATTQEQASLLELAVRLAWRQART